MKSRSDHAGYKPLVLDHGTAPSQSQPSKKWSRLWRVINFVMTIFFGLAAYVQINDPDPYVWIPAYVIPSLLSLALVINPDVTETTMWKVTCIIHISVCIVASMYCVALLVEVMAGVAVNPLIHEEGRELGGLIIVILWLSVCRFTGVGSVDSSKSSMNSLLLMTCILGLLPLAFWLLCFIEGLSTRLGHCADMFPGMLGSHR